MDLADAVFTLAYLFQGSADPICTKSADANDEGEVDLSDPVYTLSFLFQGSMPFLPSPYSGCSFDPTEDGLSCDGFELCNGF